MSEPLKKFIGVVLLVLSVGVTSCQALVSDASPPTALGPAAPTQESGRD